MDLQLEGKHVFITGGAGGIGFACAQEFRNEGCRLTLAGREQPQLDKARQALGADEREVATLLVELSDPADALRAINQAEAALGPIDVLINAAGAARQIPFAELEPNDWRAALDAKFMTYINVIDPLIKRMAERGSGSIVNIIGLGGKLPITTHLTGGAANAALMLATAGLAMAYAPQGVRVNGINPAKTETDRVAQNAIAQARQNNISVDEVLAKARKSAPIGRLATPQDIAAAATFLASPRSAYISGTILTVDGATRPVIV
ncbi:SDR family oxidoreductase [Pigmentiphaga sp. H8]|uniref:SDR family oxidoreductase n=1 Tax=Pigmentiphaga sp. H8 TaxID=2488560 RepID=UPI000F5AE257|nr:SDR family oxidoreductase [Pigmentiphaga sp. H8]AZG08215.1 SDR family oxidoreductase [Pigmentiphaga sp. H8]